MVYLPKCRMQSKNQVIRNVKKLKEEHSRRVLCTVIIFHLDNILYIFKYNLHIRI